jgi:hypothetical protein
MFIITTAVGWGGDSDAVSRGGSERLRSLEVKVGREQSYTAR